MPAIPFPRFVQELLELYRPPLRSKATRTKMAQVLREFAALPALRKTSDLSPPAIAGWIAAHPARSAVTTHSLLRSLRAACRYARIRGYLRADPFEWRSPANWIRPDEVRDPRDKHHPAEAIARVLDLADRESGGGSWSAGRLQALAYSYAFTGARKSEILGLEVADVDLAGRLILLKSNARRRLKTRGSAQPVAIAEDLAEVLALWLPRTGSPWLFPGVTLRGPWLAGGPGVRALDQVKQLG
ncbi:MAG: site-specific integrase, partial [Singulisphaera sp.]